MKKLLLSIIMCLSFIVSCDKNETLISPTILSNESISSMDQTEPAVTLDAYTETPDPTPVIVTNWEWPRSTPEEQGMSLAVLADMLDYIYDQQQQIHSILIIRNGYLVMDVYVHPFNAQTRHQVYSVTKSVTSALTGIAIADGSLGGVQDNVISYFPSIQLDDQKKADITIEHLLSMTSGIEWMEPLHSGLNDLWWIIESENPAEYFFSPALVEAPGSVFNYNSGGSHMLSVLLQQSTGEKEGDFARERLFSQMGINDFTWENDFSGHSIGGTGLELLPGDMAKIGWLYLNGGSWQGKQLVPPEWVSVSTQVHSKPSDAMGYGYQWWIRPQGDYFALGWGGQQIRVFPDQNMVVAITAGSSGNDIYHDDLIDEFILPSIQSNEVIPPDYKGQQHLLTAINMLAKPRLTRSTELSNMVDELNDKEWLVTGVGDWSMFKFHFSDNVEAQFELTMDGDPMMLAVGLDGIYRVTDTEECGPIALSGYWESENTFVLNEQILREADRRTTRFVFSGDHAVLSSDWFVEPYHEETEAELFGHP